MERETLERQRLELSKKRLRLALSQKQSQARKGAFLQTMKAK